MTIDVGAVRWQLRMIDPSGKLPIATAHKVASNNRWVEHHQHSNSQAAIEYLQHVGTDNAHLFINNAPRVKGSSRKSGYTHKARVVWADFDSDKGGEFNHELFLPGGALEGMAHLVSSGRPGNFHIYIELKQAIKPQFLKLLNWLLMKATGADSKFSDETVLRVVGSVNHKTGESVTIHTKARKRPVDPRRLKDILLELTGIPLTVARGAIEDVQPGTGDWSVVDVSWLPGHVKRLANMPEDQAVGIYGNRHKAVWAVINDLIKRKVTDPSGKRRYLNDDELHTLMDRFEAAVSKGEDEHGYDVHKDVARVLSRVGDRESADEEPDEDTGLEVLPDEDQVKHKLEQEADRIYQRRQAEKLARRWEAERGFTAPPPELSCDLSEALSHPAVPMPYVIGPRVVGELGLAGAKHNVIITAQYKTGKTTFLVGSLIQSLVDGEPFLGQFPVPEGGVVVGHWNCEMEHQELIDQYARPVEFKNANNVKLLSLRGHNLNILSDMGKEYAVEWLRSRGVKVWTIDSLARLARMAGVSEKDNEEMLNLLMAVDEIKAEAGVDACFIIAHTGRMQQEEGSERARGATVIDDWPDARWVMTRDGETRFLAVEGRGVRLSTTALVFDPATMRSVLGIGDKADVRVVGGVQVVMSIVEEQPGVKKRSLEDQVKKAMKCGVGAAREFIEEAVEGQFIARPRRDTGQRGGRPSFLYYPNEKTVVTGGATPRVMNLRRG